MEISASTRRSFVAALLGMGLLGTRPLAGRARASPDGLLALPDRTLRLTRVLQRGQGKDTAASRPAPQLTQIPAEERARIRFYLNEVHRSGTGWLDTLPGDLLFPTGIPVSRSGSVAFPRWAGRVVYAQLQRPSAARFAVARTGRTARDNIGRRV